MPESVGGLWITSYEFTRSFGVEPGSASGTGVVGGGGAGSGLAVGDYVAYTFGGIIFYGLISSVTAGVQRETGREYRFEVVDNRVRLAWQLAFGQWNMSEDPDEIHGRILPSPPAGEFSAGGATGSDSANFAAGVNAPASVPSVSVVGGSLTRGRVFGHMVPSQWAAQFKTYTVSPVSAQDILRSAFRSALGGFGFSFNFHSSQSKPVFDVDANSGMTLAALVQQVADAQGLEVTLDGSRTLRFERRGSGTLVIPGGVHLSSEGQAMSVEATKVRVVGDRTLIQFNNVPMEPDWRSAWEAFIAEPAWLQEVEDRSAQFGTVFTDDAAGRAELAARAREVTLRQYVAAVNNSAFADHGRWGKVSRMDMPVWQYLNAIVYRSYRIKDDVFICGYPARTLELHEGLLCAVEITGAGGSTAIKYRTNPLEFYPQEAAYVIAKGQPVDAVVFADREALLRVRTKDLRNEWVEMSDFTLDARNHSIRFANSVFLDGDPAAGKSILHFPNKGEGGYADVSAGLDAQSDYLRIVVPNPNFEITPAEVKCSFVFKLGRFYKDFGTGQRWVASVASAISEHLLDTSGGAGSPSGTSAYGGTLHAPSQPSGLREILYENGDNARDLAAEHSDSVIQKSGIEPSGQYIRHGAAGTSLSGVVNRVTIRVDRESGIVETVEFAKPRVTANFVTSRDFARRVRSEELFDGQADLRREVKSLRGRARMERMTTNEPQRSSSHKKISDLFSKPVGGENPSSTTYHDKNSQYPVRDGVTGWRAGDLVWLDEKGLPSRTGKVWGGVVVATPPEGSKFVQASTSGTVPMSVTPGVGPSESLGAEPGDWRAGAGGAYPMGMLAHSEVVPGTGDAAMALVRLGYGGGGVKVVISLYLIKTRPPYIPAPETPPVEGVTRIYCEWGAINNTVPDNWDAYHDLTANAKIWADINLRTTGDLLVTSWEIKTGPAMPAPLDWPTGPGTALRPAKHYILLGEYFHEFGYVANIGKGSISLSEHVVQVTPGPNGEVFLGRALTQIRLERSY